MVRFCKDEIDKVVAIRVRTFHAQVRAYHEDGQLIINGRNIIQEIKTEVGSFDRRRR